MLIIFKLEFASGGDTESLDLDHLKFLRDQPSGAGTISAYDWQLTIANDPNAGTVYPDYDSWQMRITELQQQFYGIESKTLLEVQPEGLN